MLSVVMLDVVVLSVVAPLAQGERRRSNNIKSAKITLMVNQLQSY
jgi:hypothetical protein